MTIQAAALLLPLLVCAQAPVGSSGTVGAPRDARVVDRLLITKPGVYENLIVDGEGASGNLVKITADNVVVRNLEIRNGSGNGIGIFGENVLIEDCRIHHMLNGAFDEQADAHGISGRWGDTVIRNCEIFYCSGDCIQFDPGRKSSGRVVIEDCDLWTGPLPADAAMFSAGQRPGENAFDTKTTGDGDRCVVEIRNCHLRGFKQPAQISNVAALNLKERVDVEVRNCVFSDNEIAFRVRGPGKYRDGAHVAIEDCVVYDSKFGVRAEDGIENLRLSGLGFGQGVGERIRFVEGKPKAGFTNDGEHDAPAMEEVLAGGFSRP